MINGVVQPSTGHELFVTWASPFSPAGSPYTVSVQEHADNGCSGLEQTLLVYVNSSDPASVIISASQNPSCEGSPVFFNTEVVNGGNNPLFNWFVNNNSTGATGSTYTYQPQQGDVVVCEMISNSVCVSNNQASSNQILMEVVDGPVVSFLPCYDPVTSTEAKPFRLRGGYPQGGSYSGPGVITATGFFDPAATGAGPIPVTYKYTNVHNCADSAQQTLVVQPPPAGFTCGGIWTDIRDGQGYPTVEIGGRCWFAANLDHGIQVQSSVPQTENCTVEKYCYGNNTADCNTYGALYQWDELMRYETQAEGQGLCPPGWHVPSETEWQGLMALFGGPAFAGDTLQSSGPPGFNALTGGVLYLNHTFSHKGLATLFWTSTAAGPLRVISHGMNNEDASVSYYESLRGNAFPVRCVRD